MCYHFNERNNRSIKSARVVNSLISARLIYQLSLSHKFRGADRFLVAVFFRTDPTQKPFIMSSISKKFGAISDRLNDFATEIPFANVFDYTYSVFKIQTLKPPYDTMCSPAVPAYRCLRQCLVEGYKVIDRLPFQIFLDQENGQHLNRKHVNSGDMENMTRSQYITEMDDVCHKRCQSTLCDFSYTRTSLMKMRFANNKTRFDLRIMSRSVPDTWMTYIPFMEPEDYVYYVSSCFAMWFGLSIYALNPFSWRLKRISDSRIYPTN